MCNKKYKQGGKQGVGAIYVTSIQTTTQLTNVELCLFKDGQSQETKKSYHSTQSSTTFSVAIRRNAVYNCCKEGLETVLMQKSRLQSDLPM